MDAEVVAADQNDMGRELEGCLFLQASLDSAYQRRQSGAAVSGEGWGDAFFRAFDRLPPGDGADLDVIYYVAHRTLATQAEHGLGRPLAHRILADPEAFLKSLVAAMEELNFNC